MLWCFIVLVHGSLGVTFKLNTLDALMYPVRRVANFVNLNETFFSSLENYQVNAQPLAESRYPWIARIVHSRSREYPHICTASCISERIFVTAARCIVGLKVDFTSVIYKNKQLPVLTFVVPSNGTKQAFDDIGLVVVDRGHYEGAWTTIDLINRNRTGEGFKWFDEWKLPDGPTQFKVIGYATEKAFYKIKKADRKFQLSELEVIININTCSTILTDNHRIQGFFVPCYYSCNLKQFNTKDKKCTNYHGVDGGAVIDVKQKKLLGVATWGSYFKSFELPVGFAVPNSIIFYRDYECAIRIRNDVDMFGSNKYYQSLCPN